MTKRDYEVVARAINKTLDYYSTPIEGVTTPDVIRERCAVIDVAANLAIEFAKENDRFDSVKFLNACTDGHRGVPKRP